jgi:hypothetical protein
MEVETTEVFDGAQSLKVTPAAETFTLTQTVSADKLAGSLVGIKAWVKADFNVLVCFMQGAVEGKCETVVGTNQWTEVTAIGDVTAGTDIGIRFKSQAVSTGTAYFDFVRTIANPFATTEITQEQYVRWSGYAGMGSTANVIPYFLTEQDSKNSGIFTVDNSSTNGFSVTFLKDARVTASFHSFSTGDAVETGWSLNSTQLTTALSNINEADRLIIDYGRGASTVPNAAATATFIAKAGDVIRPHTSGNGGVGSGFAVSIVAEANSQGVVVKSVESTDIASTNVFSAKVTHGAGAAVISENLDWISSVSHTPTGLLTVNFNSGVFSVIPSCVASTDVGASANITLTIANTTTSSTQIRTGVSNTGGSIDTNSIDIICHRQGSDYVTESERINVVPVTDLAGNTVEAFGSAGQTITAPPSQPLVWLTEVKDTANAFDGTNYTVQGSNSIVSIKASTIQSSDASVRLYLLKNGTQYKFLGGQSPTNSNMVQGAYISSRGEFNAGDTLSIGVDSVTTIIAQGDRFWTHLIVNEEYEPSGLLVSADVTNTTENVTRPGDLNYFYNEEMNTLLVGAITTGNGTFPNGGGSMAGGVVKETVSPLAGTESVRFTQVAGSAGDFLVFPTISVEPRNRGNLAYLSAFTTYSGTSNSVDLIVWDETNGAELGRVPVKASSSPLQHELVFNIPSNTTQLKWGFKVELVNDGAVLTIDDAEAKVNPFTPTDIYASSEWEDCGLTASDFTGFGTVSSIEDLCKRDGDDLIMSVKFTSGTSTAVEAQVNLKDGLTIDSTKIPSVQAVSTWFRGRSTTSSGGAVLATGGDTFLNFSHRSILSSDSNQNALAPANGDDTVIATDEMSFVARVPIAGWSNTAQGVVVKNVESSDIASTNTLTARIACTAGGCTTINENLDWINGNCARSSIGNYNCTINSGVFSAVPAFTGSPDDGSDRTNITFQSTSTTSFTVRVFTDDTSTNFIDGGFTVYAAKQGTDFVTESQKTYTVPIGFKESEYYSTDYQDTFWDGTGNQSLWNPALFNQDVSQSETIEIVDNFNTTAGTLATIIRAKQNIDIHISAFCDVGAGGAMVIHDETSTSTTDYIYYMGNLNSRDFATISHMEKMKKGEYLWVRCSSSVNQDGALSIWAKPSKEDGLWLGQFGQPTCYVKEVQATNVNSSTSLSAGSFVTSVLNTTEGDCSFLSLASNVITLEAGSYDVDCSQPFFVNDSTNLAYALQVRFRNTSDSTTGTLIDNGYIRGSGATAGHIDMPRVNPIGRVNIASSKNYELQVYTSNATSITAGQAINTGEQEVYGRCKITKVR